MAKIYNNSRGHLIIKMNSKEATTLDFGVRIPGLNNMCLCGSCNTECKPEDIYYICGINDVMCKECVDDFCDNMNHFVDDDSLNYEVIHFNHVAEKLNMNERAKTVPDGKYVIYNIND